MSALDPTARALLAASRNADEPSDEQLARVQSSLLAKITIGAGASVSIGAATSKAAGASLMMKLAGGVLLAGAVAGGGMLLVQREPAITAPGRSLPVAPSAPTPSTPARYEAPLDAREADVSPPTSQVRPSDAARRDGSAKSDNPALRLKAEAALVSEAQRALGAGRAGESLERLAQYEKRFPGGALRSEADATRVFALCQSGRAREATAAKESFLRRYPTSPAAPRVRNACGAR